MASTSGHGRTLDTSLIDEAAITNNPWARELLEKTVGVTRRGVLEWCSIALKIGESATDRTENIQAFSEKTESLFREMIFEIKVKAEVADLRGKIDEIWDKLELDFQERDAFRGKHTGNSVKTLQDLKAELRRCKLLKQANIKHFIDKQRTELSDMWDKCHCTEAVRNEFSLFNSDCYNEDLFNLYEREIEKYRKFYAENREIFANLQKHAKLWQEKLKLDMDSVAGGVNRYKNRGGKLLEEEKARNKLDKELPKVEEKLRRLAHNFSKSHGRQFLTFGRTVENYLESLTVQRDEDLKNILSAKKLQRSALKSNLFCRPASAPPTPSGKRTNKENETPTNYNQFQVEPTSAPLEEIQMRSRRSLFPANNKNHQ